MQHPCKKESARRHKAAAVLCCFAMLCAVCTTLLPAGAQEQEASRRAAAPDSSVTAPQAAAPAENGGTVGEPTPEPEQSGQTPTAPPTTGGPENEPAANGGLPRGQSPAEEIVSPAEQAAGSHWQTLRDSGWFTHWQEQAASAADPAPRRTARQLPAAGAAAAAGASAVQITEPGGVRTSNDGRVTVSKTISGTELENVFDITLTVDTAESISEFYLEPDMAVVIVMDISNTMNNDFGSTTRYAAAMETAESFIDLFARSSAGVSRIGYVAFNTDAQQIFPLQGCRTAAGAAALKNTLRTETGRIINADGYAASHSRFTNVEAGLKMARDMLNAADVANENKYIIFLSDGFPTTYIRSGYAGWDPYCTGGAPDADGVFYDGALGVYCQYGTNYSDKAAVRAREQAAAIKAGGITVFSVGIDIGGQTIRGYAEKAEGPGGTAAAGGFSTVDRTGTAYEIGSADSAAAYKSWLKNGIGSGYYFDSTNQDELQAAYAGIFREIRRIRTDASAAIWLTSDPLPTIQGTDGNVEFIGFFDRQGALTAGPLAGSRTEGGENTAQLGEGSVIRWDLKQSGYTTASAGGSAAYRYSLVYRVRLRNENAGFIERESCPTNGTTSLTYQLIETVGGAARISDKKQIEFPVPAVEGYISELLFEKTGAGGAPLAGAVFTLTHDTAHCAACRGDGTSVPIGPATATSGQDGLVRFEEVPSGHTYTMTETGTPAGYLKNEDIYTVVVAYDAVTVTVTHKDGSTAQWDSGRLNTVANRPDAPELPETGALWWPVPVLALLGAACLLFGLLRAKRHSL